MEAEFTLANYIRTHINYICPLTPKHKAYMILTITAFNKYFMHLYGRIYREYHSK